MSAERICALDLSLTHSGVCIVEGDYRIISSIEPKKLRGMERVEHIIERVTEAVTGCGVVAIEGYAFGARGNAVFAIAELGGIVRWTLRGLGIRYIECPPSSLKKWATGKGNADKGLMLATAIRKYGYEGSDHNEADALLLAEWARETSG